MLRRLLGKAAGHGHGKMPLGGLRPLRGHCDSTPIPGAQPVSFFFVDKKGKETAVSGLEGDSLVSVAHKHGIDLEGACACSLACSTCHVILQSETFSALEPAGEDEEDLLDLAFGLTPTCVFPRAPPARPPLCGPPPRHPYLTHAPKLIIIKSNPPRAVAPGWAAR